MKTEGPLMRDRAKRRRKAIRAWAYKGSEESAWALFFGGLTIVMAANTPTTGDLGTWLVLIFPGAIFAGFRIQAARRYFTVWWKMRAGEIPPHRPGEDPPDDDQDELEQTLIENEMRNEDRRRK